MAASDICIICREELDHTQRVIVCPGVDFEYIQYVKCDRCSIHVHFKCMQSCLSNARLPRFDANNVSAAVVKHRCVPMCPSKFHPLFDGAKHAFVVSATPYRPALQPEPWSWARLWDCTGVVALLCTAVAGMICMITSYRPFITGTDGRAIASLSGVTTLVLAGVGIQFAVTMLNYLQWPDRTAPTPALVHARRKKITCNVLDHDGSSNPDTFHRRYTSGENVLGLEHYDTITDKRAAKLTRLTGYGLHLVVMLLYVAVPYATILGASASIAILRIFEDRTVTYLGVNITTAAKNARNGVLMWITFELLYNMMPLTNTLARVFLVAASIYGSVKNIQFLVELVFPPSRAFFHVLRFSVIPVEPV